jgi:uncharacterized membrane protein
LIAGAVAGAAVGAASRGPTLVHWPEPVRRGFPYALGALAGAGVAAVLSAPNAVRRGTPRTALTVGVVVAAAGIGARVLAGRVLQSLSTQGRDLDSGFAVPPDTPTVTGGPGSALRVDQLGREGARFVGSVTAEDDVQAVLRRTAVAQPVRVFVGVESGGSVDERVGIAMDELRRTGAFDRSHLLIQSPAGTGYANPTPVDIVEILTAGDCAAVSVAYGLLPSFLSLRKVELAAETQRALLEAIHAELAGRSRRPKLLLYGESLGAKVQQAAVPRGPQDLDHFGIDAALWVGTPGGRDSDAFHLLCLPESATLDRPEQLADLSDAAPRRVWFLEHDNDPVVHFRPALLRTRPEWLPASGERGRNVPEAMTWKPGITWAQALVDTLFATDVKPGDFQSFGHDYRADLGPVVAAAFGLGADEATVQRLVERLRALEVRRAERIAA